LCYDGAMRQALKLHPDSRSAAVTGIDVEIARPRPGALILHYIVTGRIGDLRLPSVTSPGRADQLWQHTCFEAFLRATSSPAYHEFNFAPSMQWAAYRFGGYRRDMSAASLANPPQIEAQSTSERYELRASLELDGLSELPSSAPWQLGLSTVIEDASGSKSYWALAHPPGKPDFHHGDCFAGELRVPS
jgi:hypothetical protein